jgi:enamine deaminase RidA (YjgF/YER057c/UK114 family)
MNRNVDDRRAFLRRSAVAGAGIVGGTALAGVARAAPSGGSAERRLVELGLRLPPPPPQTPTIVPAVRTGNLLFLSGHGPRREDGTSITGKVGADLTVEQGYEAARVTAMNILAVVRQTLGSLDEVVRVVKVLGMVNATPDFTQQPRVINGFSEVLIDLFGDAGRGARSAVGVGSLPVNWAVEIEAIFEVR